ncbi:MAG: pyroglutamyl-peptidase I, partial [Lachnospiraceae bacterium]|nr:pyroglutamyl-peptidase I [Lachnospiraceae bacterium]
MKVLVTGFEPFGGQTTNSSASAVALLPENLGGHTIVKAILPVSYTRSDKILLAKIRECQPDIVICVGQNAGVSTIRVESTAGNYAHAESEDNDHNLWLYRSIEMSGAPSYRATLPIEKIVKNLGNAGIPAEVSHSAGTFVCNCLMYQMLRMQETELPSASCGFVHVPCLPEQCADPAKDPCM